MSAMHDGEILKPSEELTRSRFVQIVEDVKAGRFDDQLAGIHRRMREWNRALPADAELPVLVRLIGAAVGRRRRFLKKQRHPVSG